MTNPGKKNYQRIRNVYERAYHVISIAERILESEGIDARRTTIQKCWRGLDIKLMPELVKEKIREYSGLCARDPELIARAMVAEFSRVIPGYSMSTENARVQMRSIGIEPVLKGRGTGEGKKSGLSAAKFLGRVGRKKPVKGYEFCDMP